MITLFLREFKSIFKDVKSVISLFILTFVSGIFFVTGNLLSGYPAIEPVASVVMLIAALVVPLVAIFSVRRERKDGSATFTAMLPFTSSQALLGKFLALLAASVISLSVIALAPLFLALLGAKGAFNSYLGILLLYAIVAFLVAFGLVLAYAFKKTWVAITVAYFVLVLLYVLGIVAVIFESSALIALIFFVLLSFFVGTCFAITTRRAVVGLAIAFCGALATLVVFFAFPNALVNSISAFMQFISPFRRYDPTLFGLFDISSLIFYLSLTAAFLWLASVVKKPKVAHTKGKKRRPASLKVSVTAALVLLLCIVLNIAVGALPSSLTQLDVSTNSFYSISKSTKSFLKSLDSDVTVYMIDKTGVDESVINYVERYCEQSKKITLKEISTVEDPTFLSKYGLDVKDVPYGSLIIESDARYRVVSSEDFFSYYHEEIGYVSPSELEYYISYYSQMYQQYAGYVDASQLAELKDIVNSLSNDAKLCFKAEQSITEAIEYVCAEYIPAIYFLTGRGEKNTSANPIEIKGLTRIPDDVGLLIVNSPDEDYTNSETSVLLEFAERGGRIIFITNEANQKMPNLMNLLKCYGLDIQTGTISDGKSNKIAAVSNTSSGTTVPMVAASDIKTVNVGNITVEPLLTFDAKEKVGDEEQTVTKTVAALAYENQKPAVALITGADTFNVTSTDKATEEEQNEYAVAMSFLQSVTAGIKRGFESKLTFGEPKDYGAQALTVDTSSVIVFGFLLAGVVPLSLLVVPLANIFARRIRSKACGRQK